MKLNNSNLNKFEKILDKTISTVSKSNYYKKTYGLNRKNKKGRKILSFLFIIFFIFCFIYSKYINNNSNSDNIELFGPYKLVRVVDGDTIVLLINEQETKIRFIGVDTPESVHSNSEKNTDEGVDASEYLKNYLGDKDVFLEYDVSKYDKYQRTLAYVYLDDKTTMINKVLLSNGIAKIMSVPPNIKYQEEFLEIQDKAKKESIGFWKDYFK